MMMMHECVRRALRLEEDTMSEATEIAVQSPEVLRKLYEVFDELGMARRFTEEGGELEIKLGATWVLFFIDRRVMDDMAREEEAFQDSIRLAEGQWQQ